MQILDWIRFAVGLTFLILGVLVFIVQVFGIFKFKYVLNRMHAAAMGDTAGIGLCILGVAVFSGFTFTTLKLVMIVAFLWCASPVSSHLIAKLEMTVNPNFQSVCEVEESAMEEIRRETEKLKKQTGLHSTEHAEGEKDTMSMDKKEIKTDAHTSEQKEEA